MCTCQRSGVAYPRNQCSTDQCFLHFRKRTHLIFFFSLHGRRVSYHTVSVISIRGPYFLEVIEAAASHPRVENRSWAVVLKESPPGLNPGRIQSRGHAVVLLSLPANSHLIAWNAPDLEKVERESPMSK